MDSNYLMFTAVISNWSEANIGCVGMGEGGCKSALT